MTNSRSMRRLLCRTWSHCCSDLTWACTVQVAQPHHYTLYSIRRLLQDSMWLMKPYRGPLLSANKIVFPPSQCAIEFQSVVIIFLVLVLMTTLKVRLERMAYKFTSILYMHTTSCIHGLYGQNNKRSTCIWLWY